MTRLAYVNGRYLPHARAMVHIEDRGYQFADGVYEVIPVHRGRIAEARPHLDRLDYSLGQVRINIANQKEECKQELNKHRVAPQLNNEQTDRMESVSF